MLRDDPQVKDVGRTLTINEQGLLLNEEERRANWKDGKKPRSGKIVSVSSTKDEVRLDLGEPFENPEPTKRGVFSSFDKGKRISIGHAHTSRFLQGTTSAIAWIRIRRGKAALQGMKAYVDPNIQFKELASDQKIEHMVKDKLKKEFTNKQDEVRAREKLRLFKQQLKALTPLDKIIEAVKQKEEELRNADKMGEQKEQGKATEDEEEGTADAKQQEQKGSKPGSPGTKSPGTKTPGKSPGKSPGTGTPKEGTKSPKDGKPGEKKPGSGKMARSPHSPGSPLKSGITSPAQAQSGTGVGAKVVGKDGKLKEVQKKVTLTANSKAQGR